MLKAILFDMDDTLIDWGQVEIDWEAAYRRHMSGVYDYWAERVPLPDRETFFLKAWQVTISQWEAARRTLSAPHVGKILVGLGEDFGVPREHLAMDDLLAAYGWRPFPGVTVFADALEVLPALRDSGLQLGLVTNAAQPITLRERELRAYGLLDFLETSCRVSAADVGYLKPHPAIFEHALDCLGLAPENVVFVGDTVEADIAGAQAVGMRAVLRRVAHKREAQQAAIDDGVVPDAEIDTLHDLYPHLQAWYPGWQPVTTPNEHEG